MRDWNRWVREYLDLPAMTDRRDERIVGELAAHLEEAWREARARGATEADAEALVLAKLGDREQAVRELLAAERHHAAAEAARRLERTEESMRAKGRAWLSVADLLRDVRLGLRGLARKPLFTAVVVFVLALGIGATTAIFTLVDAIVLSPLPFPDADRLVTLHHAAANVGRGDVRTCAAWHFTYQDENRVFTELGIYTPGGTATITGTGEPEAVPLLGATSGVFRALGMNAVVGRTFTPADDDPDAPPVALLGPGYWRSHFGEDPGVVGRTIDINGEQTEIIGVLPPAIRSLGQNPDVIVTLQFRRANLFVGNVGYMGIARLKDGVTIEQAEADMARMLPLAFEKFPGGPVIEAAKQAHYVATAIPLKDTLVGNVANLLWVLLAGVVVVLLIACANVANLFLVRAEGKDREMAVRAAMGASRARIGWEYMKESLLLGTLGGVAGLALAYAGLRGLVALAPTQLPRIEEVSIDPRVLVFTVLVSLAASVFFGAFPIVRRGADLAESLKQGGRAGARGRALTRTQNVLAVGQMALALVLLVASGLVLRSAQELRDVDPGFSHVDDVFVFRVSVGSRLIQDPNEAALAQEAIARRLGEIAGVRSVGMATSLPMHAGGNINPLYVEGVTVQGDVPPRTHRHKWIGESYFETLGIRLLAGRAFTWADIHDRIPAVVVSESLARQYWGSVEGALGGHVSIRPDPVRWYEVIGVAADVRDDGVDVDPVPLVYWPQVALAVWQGNAPDSVLVWRSTSYAVRSDRVGTPGFFDDVRQAVWEVNPDLPLLAAGPLSAFVAQSVARTSFTLVLLGIAALVALVLGLVGVYGVISYGVRQRSLELGMRMALGADAGRLRRMVLGQGLVLAAVGIAVGLGLALLVTRAMSGLLFGVSPTDPFTFAVVAAALTIVALAASYVPAHRAAQVDPMVILRAE